MRPLLYLGLLALVLCAQANSVWSTPVESATEEKPAAAVSKDKVFYSQVSNPQEWEKWFADKKQYIQQTTTLFQEAAGIARDQGTAIQKAVFSRDTKRVSEIKKSANQKISDIIKKLQGLTPPDGLKVYHDKIVQSCQIMQSIIDAYGDGSSRYAAYSLSSLTLVMDAVKSLRELYTQHGASQENMDALADQLINSFVKDITYHPPVNQTKADK